jgi:formate/nitrite transporter FocA (FNT family)
VIACNHPPRSACRRVRHDRNIGSRLAPLWVARLLAGAAVSLGLILVVVYGAELFTGDALMITSSASQPIALGAPE